jgi:hypothetical protein
MDKISAVEKWKKVRIKAGKEAFWKSVKYFRLSFTNC